MFAENVAHNLCCQWKSQSYSPVHGICFLQRVKWYMFLTEGKMVYVSCKEQDMGGTKHDVWTLSLSFISISYKYGSILWLEDGNLYLCLLKMSHTIYVANGKVSHIHRSMIYFLIRPLSCSTKVLWYFQNFQSLDHTHVIVDY
jgi:hypothetical protein